MSGNNMASTAAASLCFLAVLGLASATTFNVANNCGSTISVSVAENPAPSPSIGISQFSLDNGQSRTLSPPDGWGGNIGYGGTASLLAEFSIDSANTPGQDHYDLSAVNGFVLDRGMSIGGGDIPVTCSAARSICPGDDVQGDNCVSPNRDDPNSDYAKAVQANCPDAFSWSGDNTKDHGSSTGRTFTITLCP